MARQDQPARAPGARRRVGIVAVLVGALVCGGALVWGVPRGEHHFARENPTVTLLPHGDLLVAGGFASPVWLGALREPGGAPSATAERYDPATGRWHPAGAMATARLQHTATPLRDGRILVAGGVTTLSDTTKTALASAEIYDPRDDTWHTTAPMDAPRAGHAATLLADGRVLVVGGRGYATGADTAADVYDPTTDRWQQTGPMGRDRTGHAATLLADGRVLVVGGHTAVSYFDTAAEIYDPATNAWGAAGALSMGRGDHTITRLSDGRVLVAGGTGATGALATTEWYDPARDVWTSGSGLTRPRAGHTATLLAAGVVLLIGGDGAGRRATTEWYDPASGAWRAGQELLLPWEQHAAVLLPTGVVVVAGGGIMRETVERYAGAGALTARPYTGGGPSTGVAVLAR